MLKRFVVYVVNSDSGSSKDVIITAPNSSKAREYDETMVLKENEKALSIFPYSSLCA